MKIISKRVRNYCESKIEKNVLGIPEGVYDFRDAHGCGAYVLRYAGRLTYNETCGNDLEQWRSSVNVSPIMRNAEEAEVITYKDNSEMVLHEQSGSFDDLSLRSLLRVARATHRAAQMTT